MALKIFCDFDGTITHRDTGTELFREVAELRELQSLYEQKKLVSQQYWETVTRNARPFSTEELDAFFRAFPIDEEFVPFAEFCRDRALDLTIVSDGLDFYIHGIFAARGIRGIPVRANAAVFVGGKLRAAFPFSREHCTRTANCKCLHVLDGAADDDSIVYIGNGISDCCPAERADIVFGKDRLAAYCESHGIPYHHFHTFGEIQRQIETYLRRPKPYKRKQAELKRRELWRME